MKIHDILRPLQDELRPMEAFWAMIEVAADKNTIQVGFDELRCRNVLRSDTAKMMINGATNLFLKLDRRERYEVVEDFLDKSSNDPHVAQFWISKGASDFLLAPVGKPDSVCFSFASCFRPFFQFVLKAADDDRSVDVHFPTGWLEIDALAHDLLGALDLLGSCSVTTYTSDDTPWERSQPVDVELMLPPMGRVVQDVEDVPATLLKRLGVTQSRHGRLNYESLCLTHGLVRQDQKTLVVVPEGALFRMVGTEATIRRDLVESGCLSQVLAVPAGTIYAQTGIKLGFMQISHTVNHRDNIWMASPPKDAFAKKAHARGAEKLSNGRPHACGWQTDFLYDPSLMREVPVSEIAENNFVLTPERYLNTGAREQLDDFFARYEVAEMADLVEMIRPSNLQKSEDGEYTLFEAAPADVNPRGYVGQPAREIKVSQATYKKALNQQIKAGDVVLAIKGTVGVVGLVPETAPNSNAEKIWTAGQSLMILRTKPRSGLNPIVLYEFLSDDTVQEFLKSMAGGAVIQNLGMKDLKSFVVPLPSAEQTAEVCKGFMQRQAVYDEIETLQSKAEALRLNQWPHSELKNQSG